MPALDDFATSDDERSGDSVETSSHLVAEVSRWRTRALGRWATEVAAETELERLQAEHRRLEADHVATVRQWHEDGETHQRQRAELVHEITVLEERIVALEKDRADKLADAEARILAMQQSSSWRVTRPLHFLGGLVRRDHQRQ